MQTTTPATTTDRSLDTRPAFAAHLDAAIEEIRGQVLLSQGRCVDHLLDLFNLTSDPVVRATVAFAIDDIRRVTAVRADELVDRLRLVAVVAEVEDAFSTTAPDHDAE
jgi:hypothetical protein